MRNLTYNTPTESLLKNSLTPQKLERNLASALRDEGSRGGAWGAGPLRSNEKNNEGTTTLNTVNEATAPDASRANDAAARPARASACCRGGKLAACQSTHGATPAA